MQKLCEMLGTKYIYDEYFNDLKEALSSVKEIDLADCKFTPKCERVLRDYYSTVLMRNTKDKDLDSILLYNVSAKNSTVFKSQPIRVNFNNMDDT